MFALLEGEEKVQSFRRAGDPLYLVAHSCDFRADGADHEKQRIDFAAAEIKRALREQLGLPHAPDPDVLDLDNEIKLFEDYFWKPTVP